MPKLISLVKSVGGSLGEYFLGTRIHRFYEDTRNFYRNQNIGKNNLKKKIYHLRIAEFNAILYSRVIPTVTSSIGLSTCLYSLFKETERGLGLKGALVILLSELMRKLQDNISYRQITETYREMEQLNKL